jgi:glucokinase
MPEFSIGLDLGGTNLRAAAVDRAGKLLDSVARETAGSQGREAILNNIVQAIETLRSRRGPDGLVGIGVAVPGFILLEEGVIRNSNNLAALEDFPIRDEIGRRLGTPVILENDANAAALGEQWIGAGRNVKDLVLLTLGTGIGGGIISNGQIIRGFLGMAGEVGHITVVPNGNPCGCGNRGCLEKHASATAITAMAKLLGLGEALSARQVFDMARNGNEKAQTVFLAVGEALGIALAMLVNTFNYPLYLLSGGVIAAWDLFAPAMLEETRRRSFSFRASDTRIEKAELGNEAGLFGAAYLPWISGLKPFISR